MKFQLFRREIILTPTWGDIQLTKNKSFEYQLEFKNWAQWFECKLAIKKKQDHAGIDFTFSCLKLFWLNLNIHDHRHWDYQNDCWKVYP